MPRLKNLKPNIKAIDISRGSSVAHTRTRGRALGKIRERIMLRDDCSCRRCGRVTADGEVDHIVPLHMGGRDVDENQQWLCVSCHQEKSDEEERGRGGSDL